MTRLVTSNVLHLNHSSGESGIFRSPKLAGDVATGEGAAGGSRFICRRRGQVRTCGDLFAGVGNHHQYRVQRVCQPPAHDLQYTSSNRTCVRDLSPITPANRALVTRTTPDSRLRISPAIRPRKDRGQLPNRARLARRARTSRTWSYVHDHRDCNGRQNRQTSQH